MNYEQIKSHVVRVDRTLEVLPVKLLDELVSKVDEYLSIDLWALHEVELPGIQCIIHALMDYDMRRYHAVGTVVMNDVPAFYYTAGGREGEDHYNYYVLDVVATKAFIKCLINVSIGKALDDVELTQVRVVDDVPELSEFYGEKIKYGTRYYYNSYSGCYVLDTK
jgi:hypothetical protein